MNSQNVHRTNKCNSPAYSVPAKHETPQREPKLFLQRHSLLHPTDIAFSVIFRQLEWTEHIANLSREVSCCKWWPVYHCYHLFDQILSWTGPPFWMVNIWESTPFPVGAAQEMEKRKHDKLWCSSDLASSHSSPHPCCESFPEFQKAGTDDVYKLTFWICSRPFASGFFDCESNTGMGTMICKKRAIHRSQVTTTRHWYQQKSRLGPPTSSIFSSSWKVRERNTADMTASFFVKIIRSLPMRIDPLKARCKQCFIVKCTDLSQNGQQWRLCFRGKSQKSKNFFLLGMGYSTSTYDFKPFPYIPISWESLDLFDDRPKVTISAASAAKYETTRIIGKQRIRMTTNVHSEPERSAVISCRNSLDDIPSPSSRKQSMYPPRRDLSGAASRHQVQSSDNCIRLKEQTQNVVSQRMMDDGHFTIYSLA